MMMDGKIALSLGVPLKNSVAYLKELFDSLEQQAYLPREILFVDDASMDQTVTIVEAFMCRHPDWNIVLHRNASSLGIAGNYNRIIDIASAAWVQILDADDFLKPHYYETVLPYLHGDGVAIITGMTSNIALINLVNSLFGWLIPQKLPTWLPVLGCFATRSGVIYRTDVVKTHQFPNPVFDGSDILHLMDLRNTGRYVSYIRQAQVFYRIHPQSTTNTMKHENRYVQSLRQQKSANVLWYYVDYYLRKKVFKFIRNC